MAQTPKIESADLSISALFNDFYVVPDFQREYVWEERNVEQFLEDILDEFSDCHGNITAGEAEYFIGSIVGCKEDNTGAFQLIDGQQRLTTIYLILCVIRDRLMHLAFSAPSTLLKQIADSRINPQTGEDVPSYRLSLQYADSDGVLEKIAQGGQSLASIQHNTESVKHILNAYEAIDTFLNTAFADDASKLKSFFAAFTLRVKLIRILTPNLAHALKVFETINDRGVGLNAMDLLKNLLFMRTSGDRHDLLKHKWKVLIDTLSGCSEKPLRFLRYFIMSRYQMERGRDVIREDEIYLWLSEHQSLTGIESKPMEFVDELVANGHAYARFASSQNANATPNRYLSNITTLSGAARQHFILLLAGQHLPEDAFVELSRQLENLYFCYLITREPTKNFETKFTKWSTELRAIKDRAGLDEFITKWFTPDRQARSNAFDFAFRELTQDKLPKYRQRYVLAKLTQFVDQDAFGNQAGFSLQGYLDSSVHIEHILPQNPSFDVAVVFDKPDEYYLYVAKLGNLTVLEKTINSAVSNNAYAEKRPGYLQSQFLLTKSLVERPQFGQNTQLNRATAGLKQFTSWKSQDITERQEMLVTLARRTWDLPD